MKEFELLPSEEQMREMARAFQSVKIRQDVMDGCLSGNHLKTDKKSCKEDARYLCENKETACDSCQELPCQNNKAAILCMAKTYYLQRDVEQALKRLHSIAPQCYRENIAELIKMKRQNSEYLLKIYTQLAGEQLPYAPNLYNGRDFCQTLGEICSLQEKILARLVELEECTQVLWLTSREIVVATALNRMSIYCFFNARR